MEALKVSRRKSKWDDGNQDRGEPEMNGDTARIEEQMKEGFAAVDKRLDKVAGEMKDGFAVVAARFEKVEGELKAGFKKVDERFEKTPTREEMHDGFAELRSEMNAGFAELRSDNNALQRTLIAAVVVIVAAVIGVPAVT